MAGIDKMIAKMARQIAELQRSQANVIRSGHVIAVDAAKGRVKVDVGNDGNPLATPWIRWTERAGARKTWNPPSVGELMTVLSPAGDIDEKSLAVHGGFTSDNGAPSSDGDAVAFSLGDVEITIKGDGITATVGGATLVLSAAGLAITGGDITHNGKSVGDAHKHSGISPGPSNTGNPI